MCGEAALHKHDCISSALHITGPSVGEWLFRPTRSPGCRGHTMITAWMDDLTRGSDAPTCRSLQALGFVPANITLTRGSPNRSGLQCMRFCPTGVICGHTPRETVKAKDRWETVVIASNIYRSYAPLKLSARQRYGRSVLTHTGKTGASSSTPSNLSITQLRHWHNCPFCEFCRWQSAGRGRFPIQVCSRSTYTLFKLDGI